MKKTLRLNGLDCPVCAKKLEEIILKIDGVISANVLFVNQSLVVEYADEGVLKKVIEVANGFEEVKVIESETPSKKHKINWLEALPIIISALLFAVGFCFEIAHGKLLEILKYITFALAYLVVGYPVLINTAKNLAKGKFFDENFLMTVASLGAICIGELHEGVAVMLLYQTGEWLQSVAVGGVRNSVVSLMELKSESATLVNEKGEYLTVQPENLKVGECILVRAGERVPVDVTLKSESATLDMKALTGESAYVDKKQGDELLSGSINAGGVFEAVVLRVYKDSATAKILELVENSAEKKAAPEKFISKFARYYTPIVCALAFLIALSAPIISYWTIGTANVSRWVRTALTLLVVSCPCALVISVPLTYFSGIGAGAKNGVLIKGATYLDVLANVNAVAFDKTGTLTKGVFSVQAVYPQDGVDKNELLSIAAALEKNSSHPIAKAFLNVKSGYICENVIEYAGKGVSGEIDGEKVLVGKKELLIENSIQCEVDGAEHTRVYVAKGKRFLGTIEIGDETREEAKETVAEFKKLGVQKTFMLTGDIENAARKVADTVGISEVYCGLLPDEKLRRAEEIRKENRLAYIGDGINDAPVMTVADVAVSMGTLGSAAAVEASDLVLVSDDLRGLVKAVKIARKTNKIVKQNVVFSLLMKIAFMVLGIIGVLPLWLAVFADVGVMLLAVLNSLRMRLKIKD